MMQQEETGGEMSKNTLRATFTGEGRARLSTYATHLIVLLIIFVLPEMLASWGHEVPKTMYLHTLVYVVVFYLNYFLIIDRLLFRQKRQWMFFAVNVLLIGIHFLVLYIFSDQMMPLHEFEGGPDMAEFPRPEEMQGIPPMQEGGPGGPDGPDGPGPGPQPFDHLGGFFTREGILLVLAVCLSVALKVGEKWEKWRVLERQMLAERQENELKNLKNQLNPHFLFNTLNNIYALIGISGQKAQLAVHELSQLLRYVLYENNSRQVPLDRDMLFIKNYIELMRLRLNSLVTLSVHINEKDGTGKTIAPLMFISLIENAFKHGVSATERTQISIAITVTGGKVNCHVENSYFPKGDSDRSGSGVGIANLKRQLTLLYPARHTYNAGCRDGKYVADLVIDLDTELTGGREPDQ